MSKIEVNTVDVQCGSTLTLGSSGKTVQLATGASQSGFGRSGTVDWQTGSIKTATFTAESGKGYFCNTTSGSFEVDLPTGSAGAIVSIQDYNNTFDSNSLTIDPNGSEKINGGDAGGPIELTTEGEGVTLVYIDSTVGWRSIHQSTFADTGSNAAYVAATGGTITTCGDYKIHTFTGPGTFTVSCGGNAAGNNQLEYVVVAGGGGGGADRAGGGGAGGFRFASPSIAPLTYPGKPLAGSTLTASAQGYPITIGSGGSGNTANPGQVGCAGSNSVFSTITSAGGGAGGAPPAPGGNGGSGGGAGCGTNGRNGGSGNTPPVSPAQGTDGGACPGGEVTGGAGGGAIGAGEDGTPTNRADGGVGAGLPTAFGSNGESSGSFRYYAGGAGGGGGDQLIPLSPNRAAGGLGGGGQGGTSNNSTNVNGEAGTTNTGGGGGGGGNNTLGANGGSGIVVIRYKFQ